MSELPGIARFKFHEGKLEEFKRLSAQCMETVRTQETGTLQYDIYFNDDQSQCIVLERYRDSEALIEHAAHVGDLMEAILATGNGLWRTRLPAIGTSTAVAGRSTSSRRAGCLPVRSRRRAGRH
jgi:quinol monooxygenase YgiN